MTGDTALPDEAIKSGNGLPMALLGHDLRAALAEMRSSLQLVQDLDLPGNLRGRIDRCRVVGDDLARLIDQSVLVCLGQASPVTTGPVVVNTAAFLAAQRLRWTGRCAETGHSFRLIAAGNLPGHFHIDRTALERVLANLVANAINHSPPGPVTMTLKISGGDLLLVVVEDEGPGFPAGHLTALQHGFVLPEGALRPGGGFGLQSVQRLVDTMGGRCSARNKATGGAAVSFCLPVPAEAAAANRPNAMPAPVAPPPDLAGVRLLLADDSASSRELVGLLAGQIGAVLQSVDTGRAAIEALQRGPLPDVVILDGEMPGATGLEVLRWLRAAGGERALLPVLALTSHTGAQEIAALHEAGASEVIAKPVLCRLELGRAIRRAQGLETGAQGCSATGPTEPPTAELVALDRLRQIAGPEAAAELFDRLQEDLAAARSGLARAAARRVLDEVRVHSHVIIALAGTVGAKDLHDDAVTLNSMTNDLEPPERIFALAERLDAAIGQLLDTVGRAASAVPPGKPEGEADR